MSSPQPTPSSPSPGKRKVSAERPVSRPVKEARNPDPATSGEDFEPQASGTVRRPGQSLPAQSKSRGGWGWAVGLGALLAAGLLWYNAGGSRSGGSDESASANWAHVVEAGQRTAAEKRDVMKLKDPLGGGQVVPAVLVSQVDRDTKLTDAASTHLKNGDRKAAEDAIAQAQIIPPIPEKAKDPSGQPIQPVRPTLTQGMAEGIRNGSTEFFQLFLYDSCDQDGDLVEVVINGVPFATVPLTKSGATLSVPIGAGSNEIVLRGIYDGGGGITVACRTSRGDFFCRSMRVGESSQVGLVQK